MKKYKALKIIIAGSLICAVVFFILVRQKSDKGFPQLIDGSYLGILTINASGENLPTDLPIFMEKSKESNELFIAVMHKDWRKPVSAVNHGMLNLEGPDGLIKLFGSAAGENAYSGFVEDGGDREIGTWYFSPITESAAVRSDREMEQLRAYLIMSAEFEKVKEEVSAQEVTVSQQKSELERLSHYVNEGDALKSNAEKKFQEEKARLKAVQEIKEAKVREAKQLNEKFELSQSLVGMGRLVSLAREYMDRENRWVESMIKSSADSNGDLDAAVARGERIAALKNEIASERQRLLEFGQRTP